MELLLALPADRKAPRIVRRALALISAFLPPASAEDVQLVANELVTNAIKHGGLRPTDEVEVRARSSPECIHVEILGGDRKFVPRVDHGPDQTSGWGLVLVGSLSNRWGYYRGDGTAVWFEIERKRRPREPVPPEQSGPGEGWAVIQDPRSKKRWSSGEAS